ncbi:hypothetical protein PAXINDRAFT_167859 [Paxillus involutus ATCC 200175]|nr:hypothetical protein PAXINDRAFT_167859 [Paxillus involutus ATCC 200175]
MSSRFAEPTTTRTRSPIFHDESPKRPLHSPSNKVPPPKKPDAKSRPVSEEPSPPSKAPLASMVQSQASPAQSYLDESPRDPDVVDMEVFNQILELDDEDGFYQEMVQNYLDQAVETIRLMDECFSKQELNQLGKHGHFLKGSSAALGVVHVRDICEEIQHLGDRMDPDKESGVKMSVEVALARIKPLLTRLMDEHTKSAKWFDAFERP